MSNPIYEIPLDPFPQTFRIALGGVQYVMTVRYRVAANGSWLLDIADATGNAIVAGIPLITGADLLAQYAYLGIGGKLVVGADTDDLPPTFSNLGLTTHLYFQAA